MGMIKSVKIIEEKIRELERKSDKLQEQQNEYQKYLSILHDRDQKYFGAEYRRYQRYIQRTEIQLNRIHQNRIVLDDKLKRLLV